MTTASLGQQISPGLYVKEIHRIFLPFDAKHEDVLVLTGYFDESGFHEGGTLGASPVVVMAGYIASTDQWISFSDEWQDVLDKAGLEYFHMTDFNAGQRQFNGISESKKEVLIDNLTRLISVRTRMGFIVSYYKSDYDAVINEQPRRAIVKPYALCDMMCTLCVKLWAEQYNYSEPIPYVFDRGARYSKQWMAAYDLFIKQNKAMAEEYLLGTFALEDKKRYKPLQAADVLAYGSYRQKYNEVAGNPIRIKYPMKRIFDAPLVRSHFDLEHIRDVFTSIDYLDLESI